MLLRNGHRIRLVLALAVTATVVAVLWFHHGARPVERFTGSASVTASGLEVTAQALVATLAGSGTTGTTAEYAGVCFTDASGARVDFPVQRDVALSASPATLVSTGTLRAGRYSFGGCVRVDGVWSAVGTTASVDLSDGAPSRTVTTPTPSGPSTAAPSPADAASPGTAPAASATPSAGATALSGAGTDVPTADAPLPRGDLPGWHQVLAEDFSTDLAEGLFPGKPYRDRWVGYDGFEDSSGSFRYDTRDVASVHDGVLDLRLRTEGGTALGAGVAALVNGDGTWGGRTHGRYSVRFRANPGVQWGSAFLLWSDTDTWTEGEIDFAEGMTTATTIDAHNHQLATPADNALSTFTPATWDRWHVATVEWTADAVRFYLDGYLTGTSDVVPQAPLHLVLQTLTGKQVPPPDSTANLLVDWVAGYEED